ncbi:MAG: DUF4922 domain-containing protein [Melioribacteraceae bacterium]
MQIEFPDTKLYLNNDDSLSGLAEKAERLFEHQLKNWQLASEGYRSFTATQIKKFEFDNFTIEAHFNSGRIISSLAKVDANICRTNLRIGKS